MTREQINLAKSKFIEEKENLIRFNESVKSAVAVNEYLKQFNWAFVHPYMANFELAYLNNLKIEGTGNSKAVFAIFAKFFFDLRNTAAFIDGSFKTRDSLAPFCQIIDQSVFLCLQLDYAGAINCLLPVIEGSIRHYLVYKQGRKNDSTKNTKDMLKVFYHLKNDFIKNKREYYEQHFNEHLGKKIDLEENQIEQLLMYQGEFIEMWFGILQDHFKNNLYVSQEAGTSPDPLNRHIIFHGITTDIYYNLENYLKIFNSIVFLSYAFGMAQPGSSLLIDIETKDIVYKWKAFEKIRTISKLTSPIKASVYSKYTDFDPLLFEETLFTDPVGKSLSNLASLSVEHKLQQIDSILDKALKAQAEEFTRLKKRK